MRFRSAVPGLVFLQCCGWFPFVFHKSKRAPVFCLMAGLLPALFVPTAVAQSSTNTPIFQFGAFYNLDLDFSPGQMMTMNGKVHVNGTFWMYPQASVTFNDTVEATVVVTNMDDPNDQQNLTSYTTPTYNFTANGGKPLSGVGTLNMLINTTNVEAILNLPPAGLGVPNDAGYMPSNQIYLYNECDSYHLQFCQRHQWQQWLGHQPQRLFR